MKPLALVAALLSVSLVCAVNYAQDPKPPASKPTSQKSIFQTIYYRQMADVCGLSAEQKTKIESLVQEHQKAVAELEPKLKAADATLKAARESKNDPAIAQAKKDQAALKQQIGDLDKKNQADIKAVMTPEQQTKWQEYQKLNAVKRHYTAVDFTPEQVEKIKPIIKDAFANVPAGDNEANAAAMKVYGRVESEVLTAEQKTQLASRAASRPTSKPAPK